MAQVSMNRPPWETQDDAGFPVVSPELQATRDRERTRMLQAEYDAAAASGNANDMRMLEREMRNDVTVMGRGGAGTPMRATAASAPAPAPQERTELPNFAPWEQPATETPRGRYAFPLPGDFPAEEKSPGVLRRVGDVGTKLISSVPRAGASLSGLVGLVPGASAVTDPAGKVMNNLAQAIDSALLSAYQIGKEKELSAILSSKDNFMDQAEAALEFLAKNPSQIGTTIAGSGAEILSGGVLGRGVQLGTRAAGLGRISPVAAGSIGEGGMIAGGVSSQIAQGGGDYADRLYAVPAGVAGAAVSRLSGGLLGRSDIDTALVRGLTREGAETTASRLAQGEAADILRPAGSMTGRVGRGVLGEGLLEEAPQSAMEQAAVNLGLDRPVTEGMGGAVAVGTVAGSAMGGTFAAGRPSDTYTPAESREALRIMADRDSPVEQKAIAANFIRGIEAGRLGQEEAARRFNDYIDDLRREKERVDPTPTDLLAGGLQQVETRPGAGQEGMVGLGGPLGRTMERMVPTGITGVLLNTATGNYELATEPATPQRVLTQRPLEDIPGMTVDEAGIYRMAEPAVASLSPPSAPRAASPGVTTPPGVFSTPTPAAPKVTKRVKAEPQAPSTLKLVNDLEEELDLDTEGDQQRLTTAIDTANKLTGKNPLQAQIQGPKGTAAPGRVKLAQRQLQGIRDALLRKSGKVAKAFGRNEQKIVDATRQFAAAFNAYVSQGSNLIRSDEGNKNIAGAETVAERRVGKLNALAAETRNALASLGAAVGGNAKDVEAIVRLVKDTVQAKKAKPGKTKAETIKALTKLDTTLSTAWAAAKRESFMDEVSDLGDVSGQQARQSTEQQEKGKTTSPIEEATKGYSNPRGNGAEKYTGVLGALQYLRFNTTPMGKVLARALRESLKESANTPNIVFENKGKSRYDPSTNTIYINRSEQSPEVVLHETFHAALQWYVYQNPKSSPVLQLQKSLKTVLAAKGLTGKAKEVQDVLQKLVGEKRNLDAVLELVSYNATLNEFRKALQAMPTEGVPKSFYESAFSIWRMVTAITRRLLGVGNNVASDVLAASMKLLEGTVTKAMPEKLTGKVLEAAVVSSNTNSPLPNQVSNVDFRAFANSQESWRLPTQIAGELLGFGKNGTTTKKIREKGAKLAQKIRKDYPSLETFILNFNSKFSNGILTNKLISSFKFDQNTGYMQAEKIAEYLDAHPDVAKPFLDYMDGDKTALKKIDDNGRLQAQADYLLDMHRRYIESLPENSSERAYFTDKKFSEYIIVPRKVSQVAGTTFGVKTLASMLGIKPITERNIDFFKPWLKEVDGVLEGDNLYQVMEKIDGELVHAGFMAKDKFDADGTPTGFTVKTDLIWRMSALNDGAYKFTARMTAAQAVARNEISKVTTALLNTTAALAHTYASRNFLTGMSTVGYEGGKPTAESVAFDSVKQINSVFKGRTINENDVVEASDEVIKSPKTRTLLQRTGTWVKLPDSSTYGDLAGKYMPGPVWNSMVDMHDRSPLINSRIFNETMGWFKEAKTIFNPGTHVTNFLTNITLSYLHNIPVTTTTKAARLFALYELSPGRLSKDEMKLMQSFMSSGAMLGEYTSAEVKKTIYEALEKAIKPDSDSSVITKLNAFSQYEKIKAGFGKLRSKAKEVYAAEDNIFRLAAYMNTAGNIQLRDKTSVLSESQLQEAGLAARGMFLDYDIDARAVRAARQSVLPFVSWSYAIMPVLGRIAIEKPWTIANVMLAYMLAQAAMGSGDEEDEELRKAGPKYVRDRAFGTGPYMFMRVPFMGDDETPVYFNLGKYVPFFSIFQPPPGQSAPAGQTWIPGFLTPSGPIVSLVSAMTGYDPFTGKPLHQPTDSEWDKLMNFGRATYDTVAPPALNSQFIKNLDDLSTGKTTATGREPDTLFLARKLGGLGLYEFNVEESLIRQEKAVKGIQRDFKTAMKRAKEEEYRKGYPDYEALDEELETLRERMDKRISDVRGGEEEE